MTVSAHPAEQEIKSVDVDALARLYRRQDDLEKELQVLRNMYKEMKDKNEKTIDRVHDRIDKLEKELGELRETLNELKASIGLVQVSVNTVQKHVSEINAKSDITIEAQDKFISQLWKAFFTVLGFVSIAATAIFALAK